MTSNDISSWKSIVLLAYLNHLFDYQTNKELLSDTRNVAEGFNSKGRSFLYHHLITSRSKIKLPKGTLKHYDDLLGLYPQSLELALILASVWLARKHRWLGCALTALLSGLTHSTALPLTLFLLLEAVHFIRQKKTIPGAG